MKPQDSNSRRLPLANENAARVVGSAGVLACVLCCISIPGVVAVISAMGLGLLRDDRILLPAEMVSLVILIFTFTRSRATHHRNAPLISGMAAAALMFFGLLTPAPTGTIAALAGSVAFVGVVVWDWRLQKRCA